MGLFVDTDASTISKWLITKAQDGCNTTLYDGDERRIFIESVITPIFVALYNVVDDVAKQKMRKYARGSVLDAIGGEKCPRMEAKHAMTRLCFWIDSAAESDIIIPAGTKVSSNDEHYFITDEECCIKLGMLQTEVSASAISGGSDYNGLIEGAVSVLVDSIKGISGCKNIEETYGGDDGEPYDTQGDDRYRERIGLYEDAVSTCGTENGYRYYVLSSDSKISGVNIVTSDDVGGPDDYDVLIYVECDGGVSPNEDTINAIYEKCNAKDARPMCDRILVSAAEHVDYDIEVTYYVSDADEKEAITKIEGEGGVIEEFIDQQDVAVAQPINPDTLFAGIMNAQNGSKKIGIKRCSITFPVYKELQYNQVAHFSGKLKVRHEVVE